MKKIKNLITPISVISILLFSIVFNIVEAYNNRPTTNKPLSSAVNPSVLNSAKLGEKLSMSINGTRLDMKLDRAETSSFSFKDAGKGEITKKVYFQVFATIKNSGGKTFSFNSVPVYGVSSDNFVFIAKNIPTQDSTNNAIVTTNEILPNQNSNLIGSSFEIKPGEERSGYFFFENETQNIQLISNGVSYVWQTGKVGMPFHGKEIPFNKTFISTNNHINLTTVKQQQATLSNRDLNIITFEISNTTHEDIPVFSYIPKYGTSIPGIVSSVETISENDAKQFDALSIDEKTVLPANTTKKYAVAFSKDTKFIFPRPPLVSDSTNEKLVL